MVKKLYFCDDKCGIMKDFLKNMPQFLVSGTVVAAVLYLTLAPKPLPDNDINWFKHTDKIVHAVMMAGVYLAVALDYIKHRRQPCGLPPAALGCILAAVIVFGGSIELLQGAMDMGRGCDLYDFIADSAGACSGYLISMRYSGRMASWLYG